MTKYFTKYSINGASSRVRTFQFLEEAEFVSPLFNHRYLVNKYQGKINIADIFISYLRRIIQLFTTNDKIIYVEKEFLPYFPFAFEHAILKISGILTKDTKFIIDIDDAIFVNYKRTKLKNFFLGRKIEKLMSIADIVICGSYTLLEYSKIYNQSCIYLPSTYECKSKNEILTLTYPIKIGWVGTPNTQKYLIDFLNDFPNELREFFEFHLIGAKSSLLEHVDTDMNIVFKSWSSESEGDLISKIHFGIMPITKSDFEYFKCGYKIIQYFAHSKPTIATRHGANIDIVSHSKDGFLIDDDLESYIHTILNMTNQQYQQMCKSAKQKYVEAFNFEDVKEKFCAITN